ncbi:MAG: fibronectin type III domain-containing protein, partial [Bacteroides sp.]|nr:fibronectin type III domain-containing protein [Bacteroides sp.]
EIRALCSAQDTSDAKQISFVTARGIPYAVDDFNVERFSDIGFSSWKGMPGGVLASADEEENAWNLVPDESGGKESVAGFFQNLSVSARSWLVSPVVFSGYRGRAVLSVDMSAWLDAGSAGNRQRRPATGIDNDTLFVFRSADGRFDTALEVVGRIILDSLTPEYRTFDCEFDVGEGSPNVLGLYFKGIHDGSESNESSMGISRIDLRYVWAEYPAVTNLRTADLTPTGVTIRWNGEAVSYAVLYRKRADEGFDTAYTDMTECRLTGLASGTQYAYRVVGYYGEDRTLPGEMSPERYVNIPAEVSCGRPTGLASEYDAGKREALLSWTPGENNNGLTLVYLRPAASQQYDTAEESGTSHVWKDLEAGTVYHWRVQAYCDDRLSEPSDEESIEAADNEGNAYARALRISVIGDGISVENPENRYIKRLNVYSVTGVLLRSYAVESDGNLFVSTGLTRGMVVVEAVGSGPERAAVKAVVM